MDMKGAYIMCNDTMKALDLFELDGTTTAFQFHEGSVHYYHGDDGPADGIGAEYLPDSPVVAAIIHGLHDYVSSGYISYDDARDVISMTIMDYVSHQYDDSIHIRYDFTRMKSLYIMAIGCMMNIRGCMASYYMNAGHWKFMAHLIMDNMNSIHDIEHHKAKLLIKSLNFIIAHWDADRADMPSISYDDAFIRTVYHDINDGGPYGLVSQYLMMKYDGLLDVLGSMTHDDVKKFDGYDINGILSMNTASRVLQAMLMMVRDDNYDPSAITLDDCHDASTAIDAMMMVELPECSTHQQSNTTVVFNVNDNSPSINLTLGNFAAQYIDNVHAFHATMLHIILKRAELTVLMQDTSSHHDANDGTFIPLPDTVILDAAAMLPMPFVVEEAKMNVSHRSH